MTRHFKVLVGNTLEAVASFYTRKGYGLEDEGIEWFSKVESDPKYARDYINLLEDTNYIKLKKVVSVIDFIESYNKEIKRPASVLEIGCGEGRYSGVLGYTGNNITAIDFNQEHVKAAQERVASLGFENVEVLCADAFKYLENNPDKFDFVPWT